MKHIGLKIILLLLPLWTFSFAPQGKYKKLKTIQRSFDAGPNGTVVINNTYGNINVITGKTAQVTITVHIKVDGDDNEAVEKRFNHIKVHIDQSGSVITAETIFGKYTESGGGWLSWIFGGSRKTTNFKINYEVRMPEQWDLKIDNDYGQIYLNKLTGNLDLNADYGSFEIGQLLGNQNQIRTDYFTHSNIDFVKEADIQADYSRIHIDSAYRLDLNCDYTTIDIEEVRFLTFNNDYGSIAVDNVKEVRGNGDYQVRKFGNVNTVRFSGDYGSLTIDGLLPGFNLVNLSCDYTSIKIINRQKVPFRFELDQTYGCFKPGNLEVYKEINDNGDKEIRAFYDDRHVNSLIKIDLEYGCVKIED